MMINASVSEMDVPAAKTTAITLPIDNNHRIMRSPNRAAGWVADPHSEREYKMQISHRGGSFGISMKSVHDPAVGATKLKGKHNIVRIRPGH